MNARVLPAFRHLLVAAVIAALAALSLAPLAHAQTTYPGQYVEANCGSASSTAVAFTSAAPGVGTWATPPWSSVGNVTNFTCPIIFTSTEPTGISDATNYWIVPISLSAGTFNVATSAANALAGTFVTTTSATTATHATSNIALSTTAGLPTVAMALPAGDWDCQASVFYVPTSTTSVTNLQEGISAAATTIGSLGSYSDLETAANVMTVTNNPVLATPVVRQALGVGPTNVYGVALATFTASTLQATGDLRCRKALAQG